MLICIVFELKDVLHSYLAHTRTPFDKMLFLDVHCLSLFT